MKAKLFIRDFRKRNTKPSLTWEQALKIEIADWIQLAHEQTWEKYTDNDKRGVPGPEHDRYHGWMLAAKIATFHLRHMPYINTEVEPRHHVCKPDYAEAHKRIVSEITTAQAVEHAAGAYGFHASGGALQCVQNTLTRLHQDVLCKHDFGGPTYWSDYPETPFWGYTIKCKKCGKVIEMIDLSENIMRAKWDHDRQMVTPPDWSEIW